MQYICEFKGKYTVKIAKRVSSISSSVTLDITSKAKKMAREGVDVVNFGAGEPDFDTPEHIKTAAIKAINEGFTKYTPSSGTEELREAICRKFKSDNNLDYITKQIVVSSGAKHSLYNIFQTICDAGDEVIIPSPYWLSYPEMVKMAEAIPVYLKAGMENGFKITASSLEGAITKKTRAFILNSPSNPAGSVYDENELKFIAELAIKHNFYVISDEIYEKLIYGKTRHISIASINKDVYGRTVTVNGVSKSYAMTGWRIGYAAGPIEVMAAISNLQSHSTSNPSSISQKAALAALAGDQRCVGQMRSEFESRRDLMISKMSEVKKIRCVSPNGAFYVFCDISRLGLDSLKLAGRLLEEARVAVVPGAPFGADTFIRLSFASSPENITRGIDRIKEWVNKNG